MIADLYVRRRDYMPCDDGYHRQLLGHDLLYLAEQCGAFLRIRLGRLLGKKLVDAGFPFGRRRLLLGVPLMSGGVTVEEIAKR